MCGICGDLRFAHAGPVVPERDELFAGYMRFPAVLSAERLPRSLGRLMSAVLSKLPTPTSDRHLLARAQRFAQSAAFSTDDRMTSLESFFYEDIHTLITNDYRAADDTLDHDAYLRRVLPSMAPLATLGHPLHSTH